MSSSFLSVVWFCINQIQTQLAYLLRQKENLIASMEPEKRKEYQNIIDKTHEKVRQLNAISLN